MIEDKTPENPDHASAKDLLRRWRSGDADAADELHRRYAQRLCRLAEGQIGRQLRRRLDADDVVQSAFRTFFRRTSDGEYSVNHSGALWQLLVRITLNKAKRDAAVHRAAKRDVAVEVYPDEHSVAPEAVAHDPTPEECLSLVEELESLLDDLSPSQARMVYLSLEGHSVGDIAAECGGSRFTVRRILDRVGHSLRRRLRADP